MAARRLPPEIIDNILSRVPAKSIGRFWCVSKQWRSLLSQPYFIKAHLNQIKRTLSSMMNESLLIVKQTSLYSASLSNGIARQMFDEMTTVATKLNLLARDPYLLEGCATLDGLILIENYACKWLLLNPITGEIRVLPDAPISRMYPWYPGMKYGLGYDHITDDYKVVIFGPEKELQVNVCSVRTGIWKECSDRSSHVDGTIHHSTGLFHHGRIHWISVSFGRFMPDIVAFDLLEEKFYNVSAPGLPSDEFYMHDRLGVLEGCLGYICCVSKSREVEVWVMKQYGVQESWTKIKIMMVEAQDTLFSYSIVI